MITDESIYDDFCARLTTVRDDLDEDDETLPIKFVATGAFTVPNHKKYLEVIFLPNNPTDQYWDDTQIFRGSFRVILHWPNNGQGTQEPMRLLKSVLDGFPKGKITESLKVSQVPKTMTPLETDDDIIYPSNIRYNSFS